MGATQTGAPGRIKRTEITESYDTAPAKPKYYSFPEEFWQFIRSSTAAELQNWIIYIYRMRDRDSSKADGAYVDKLIPTPQFDEDFIRTKCGFDEKGLGGGFFKIILKDQAGQWRSQGVIEIAGPPRDAFGNPAAPASAPGHANDLQNATTDMLIRELLAEIRAGRQGNLQQEFRSALELNRSALTGAAQTLRELNPAPATGGAMDEDKFLDRLMKFKTLFDRPAENPLAIIQTFGAIAEAMKGITGTNVKTDAWSTLIANLPAITDKLVGGVKDYRLGAEAQERSILGQSRDRAGEWKSDHRGIEWRAAGHASSRARPASCAITAGTA